MSGQVCTPFQFIDTRYQLDELIAYMADVNQIALDTEADSLHHYYAKVCLIQLTFGDRNYIVDPLGGIDLSGFLDVLSQKKLFLHGADYDLRMLRSTFGFRPQQEVFDTMIAAQYLGYTEFGLSALVQRFFDIELANLGKKTNWSRRPLTPAQLKYACEDTHYLFPLAGILAAELEKKGRCQWHREACERVVTATALDKPRDLEKVWRIKGVRFLDRRQMSFLREIWHWRENEAQITDVPAFKVMGNKNMLDLVLWVTANPDRSLSEGPKLPRNCLGSRLAYLEKAVHKARNMPQSEWPVTRKKQPPVIQVPNCKTQIDALMKECMELSGKLGIASSVLATRAALTSIAQHRPQSISEIISCSSMMRWQAELLLPAIKRIVSNEDVFSQ